jgi:hypothetical protein
MKKFLPAVLLIAGFAFAVSEKGFDVRYERTKSDQIVLNFDVDKYSIGSVEKDGVIYSTIDYKGRVTTSDKGYAAVPRFTATVQLKDDKNVDIKYSASDYVEYKLDHPLLPSRGVIARNQDPDKIPYEISPESVKDEWYPANVAENIEPFILRDIRGTTVIVHPFQYNAAKKILRVYGQLTVTLTENNDIPFNPLVRKSNKVAGEMSGIYKTLFLNYNETKAMELGEFGEILLVYTTQNGGLTSLQPWIQWKREMGYKVNLLEVPNNTDLSVSGHIQTAYNANPNILYVQLVGDWANLKSALLNSVTSTIGAQDPMLGCVVGVDQYIDLMVGRFSVQSSTDVANQINKAINYEKNPDLSGTWYNKALGMARLEGGSGADDGENDDQHQEYVRNRLLTPSFNYTTVYRQYDGGSSFVPSNATASTVSQCINDGVSILNYINHGNETSWSVAGYSNTHVNALTNGNKLPFVISVACLVGHVSWSTGDCFAETWLKKSGGGAVVGMFSSISQPWAPPMCGQDYFNDILIGGYDYNSLPGAGIVIDEQRTTFGALACNATNLMLQENPSDAATKDTQEAWLIFGDVTLQVRTNQPALISNSSTTVLPSTYSTAITSGANPVEGARVSLYKDGVNATGLTDANGNVTISHSFSPGDNVTLTVTGYNLETEQSTQMVTGDIGGTFAINQTSLSYGNVDAGSTSIRTFQITNSHGTEYLTGDITTPAGYSVAQASKEFTKDVKNTLSYAVAPNSSKIFNLTFAPTAGQTYSGNVVVTSSDTGHSSQNIAVTGTGTVPEIALSVASLTATTAPEASTTKTFDITNSGLGTLNYSLSVNYTDTKDLKASGEDIFGYKWKDSDEPDGPAYNWVDITGVGTNMGFTGIDQTISNTTLGFDFNFYGNTFNSVNVCSNGWVSFTSTATTYTNVTIPNSAEPNNMIAPYWDDLDPSSSPSGAIWYYRDTANSRFIVSYVNIENYSSTTTNTFQILIYESGKIVFQYNTMNGSKTSCTVGIENATGSVGSLVNYNTAYLKNNFAIQFQATPEWLTLDKTSGTVASGKLSETITATCSAEGLEVGTYTADITVTSNDPDDGSVVIPVTFNVSLGETGGIFAVNQSSLLYGSLEVGSNSVKQFTITNSHSSQYLMGNITTINGYTVAAAAKEEGSEAKNVLSYTVSPNSSKIYDLTFAPAVPGTYNGNITITSTDTGHATNYISVTGTGTGPDVILSEGFDGATYPPAGWSSTDVSGTTGIWSRETTGTYPTCSPQSGTAMSKFNSFTCAAGVKRRLSTPAVSLVGKTNNSLKFWMYRDNGYSSAVDSLEVYASLNGTDWTKLKGYKRYSTSNGWVENTVSLSSYDGQSVYVSFVGCSAYGNNIFIDNISVSGYAPSAPGAPSNVATSISGSDLTISWTAVSGATSYDVYSADDPYGTFSFAVNVATNSYTTTYSAAKKFWYVVSKNATK